MTLQQSLQANTTKINELFNQLQNTSNQAVKTRENLFGDLSRELRLHADLEQKHLLPALRGNEDNKELVAEAAKTNRELRGKLDEVEALPKGDGDFLPRLAELRKLFKEQLREERKDLVPAAKRSLSDEQAERVADKIDAQRERAEEEQRAAEEARKEAARLEREQEKAAAARKQAADEAAEAAKRSARELSGSARELGKAASVAVRQQADKARDTSEKAVENVKEAAVRARDEATDTARRVKDEAEKTARNVKDSATESANAIREEARERGADIKAVGNALRNFGRIGSELRSVMVDSIKRSGRDSLEMGKQLIRNPRKFGQVQKDYAAAATRNLMESTNAMLLIVRSGSSTARRPVEQRLEATS